MSPWLKLALSAIGVFTIACLACGFWWLTVRVSGIVDGHEMAMDHARAEVRAQCIPWSTIDKERKLTGTIVCKPLGFMRSEQ
jgi:hypothetical protein